MTISKDNVTAVILAGGKGRRLDGQDKGLVELNDIPLIEYVLERITPQVNTLIINANRNQAHYEKYGYSVISDHLSDFQGPLAGVVAAMTAVNTSYLLTLPCDAPFIPHDLVDRMLSQLAMQFPANHSKDVQTKDVQTKKEMIVVAHDGKQLQTVHALIPVALLQSLQTFLHTDQRKVEDWYQQHELLITDFSDIPHAFVNINTQKQRQEIEFTLQ